MKKSFKKIVAGAMTAAMTMSLGIAVPVMGADGDTTDAKTQLRDLLSIESAGELIPATEEDSFRVTKVQLNNDPTEVMSYEANLLKGKKFAAIDKDYVDEFFVQFAGNKVKVYEYNEETVEKSKKLPAIATINNVKEVRYKAGKTVTFKQVKGKKTSYATYKVVSGKLKLQSVYSKNGKTYKKGTKKIKKATFDKYVKTYKKLKKLKFSKVDADANLYVRPVNLDEMYISPNIAYAWWYGDSSTEVYTRDSSDKQDEYKSFFNNLAGTVGPVRNILGPNTTIPGTDKTYQQVDWENAIMLTYDDMLKVNYDDDGYGILTEICRSDDYRIAVEDIETGKQFYATYVKDGLEADSRYVLVFDDKDRLTSVSLEYSNGVIGCLWTFDYGTDAEVDGQWADPYAFAQCYPTSDFTGTTRTIPVDFAGTSREIKVASEVAVALSNSDALEMSLGQFFFSNGEEKIAIPFENVDLIDELDLAVNPPLDGADGYDNAGAVLSWKAK